MGDNGGSAHSSMFGDLSTEEVTSKIILTAIIVLFMAVLFVLILHLYAKLYWWRIDQLQQQQQQQQQQEQDQEQEEDQSSTAPPLITRRQRRRFIFVPGQDALSNTGLTPFELTSLPIVFFRQDSCKDGLECSICLSELVKGDKARLLPKCNHSFHVECIDMWFQSHSTCPICRNTVLGPEQPSSKRVEHVPENVDHVGGTNSNHDTLSQISTSPEFPTNVLVWGRQDQVSTGNTNGGPQEDGAGNAASQSQETVVLDINDSSVRSQNVSSSSSSVRYIVEEEEPKSPMTTRLRSLRRFLSRDKRVACSNSSTSSSSANAATSVDP
ncbi:hypothetical protein CARUB_v10020652mg [Capsella rubella]|uniref:RING-type E3 ubiquitin transferase n=1 Tax=Capsella rubella TaxID=81985 RepID=R0HZY2_9BRAS|nr:RING-H2 finger protein ATL3 [Capsella rubella]EOA35449.1 hypothetical protein CARUB_v10020652mg [Capsella rubella]